MCAVAHYQGCIKDIHPCALQSMIHTPVRSTIHGFIDTARQQIVALPGIPVGVTGLLAVSIAARGRPSSPTRDELTCRQDRILLTLNPSGSIPIKLLSGQGGWWDTFTVSSSGSIPIYQLSEQGGCDTVVVIWSIQIGLQWGLAILIKDRSCYGPAEHLLNWGGHQLTRHQDLDNDMHAH